LTYTNNGCQSAPNPAFVTILVGEEETKFVVHRDLMLHYSSFFKTAFEGPFAEHETETMRQKDTDSRLFGVLVHWLYTRKIEYDDTLLSSSLIMSGLSKWTTSDATSQEVSELMKKALLMTMLWTLAETYRVRELQNDAMGALYKLIESLLFPEDLLPMICYAYKDGKPTPLKQLLIKSVAFNSDLCPGWVDDATELTEAVVDVAKELTERLLYPDRGMGSVDRFFVAISEDKK
jgi:hypothetical protein